MNSTNGCSGFAPECRPKSSINLSGSFHRRYLNNEARFNRALCKEISLRKINVRAKDICTKAGVTAPTFYSHYHNTDDARKNYELSLEQELAQWIPKAAHRNVVLTVLPSFIANNYQYFLAVHKSRDHYLLTKVIIKYRINLVGERISDRAFYMYAGSVQSVIACWLELSEPNQETIEKCARELIKLRVSKI